MKKIFMIATLMLGIMACGKPSDNKVSNEEKKSKAVKVTIANKKILSGKISGNGSFEPVSEAPQFSPEAEVVKVYFKNGDRVKAGNIVIQLDDRAVKSAYETAKANLMTAEANYNKTKKFAKLQEQSQFESAKAAMINARESLDKAVRGSKSEELDISNLSLNTAKLNYEQIKFNYDRNKKLYNEKLISQVAYLDVETQYLNAKSSLEKAQKNLEILQMGADKEDIKKLEANYNQSKFYYELSQKNMSEKIWQNDITTSESSYLIAKANYELSKKNYDDLTVRAKIDGVIANLDIKTYERTTKNANLFYVIEDNSMTIKMGLSALEVLQVTKGAKANVFIEELKGKAIPGEVIEIDPSADPKTNKFMVNIKVNNENSTIKKGMYAKVEINTSAREMLVIPKLSVVVKDLYNYVFKIENGKAKQIKVEIGNSTGELQEILTDGIKSGDKIVIDGQYLLQDNDSVQEVK